MEDFKRSINNIHAPQELLKKTMEKMHEENERLQQEEAAPIRVVQAVQDNEETKQETNGKIIYLRQHIRQVVALAACLVLVLGGTIYYQSTNRVAWNTLPQGTTIVNSKSSNGLPAIESTATKELAELYKTQKTKKIGGHDVLFIRDDENDVYIAYWEDGDTKQTYVSDPGAKEKDFLEEVKGMLKK